MVPGSPGPPNMVCVLPLPVWPYANTVQFTPAGQGGRERKGQVQGAGKVAHASRSGGSRPRRWWWWWWCEALAWDKPRGALH